MDTLTRTLSFENNLNKFSEQEIESAEKMKNVLNPKNSSIEVLKFHHDFYHDIDTLSYVLEEMLQIFQPGVKYLVAEYDQTSEIYSYLCDLKDELKKYEHENQNLKTSKKK